MKPFEVTLEKGLSAKMEFTVGEKDTAKYYGSGKSEILATPALVRYMEATAQKIVDTGIPHDWQSIGTFFSVEHNSATPAGFDVEIHAILVSIDDKDLTFEISAFDNSGRIATGIHKRIVTKTATLERLLKKKSR
ncbi:thioesterase family protein [Oxalobacter formigenes]|uniref:thioesterase family protein n=1 Tax=Oxalobacter formigenes TaxID=847 RepID=UPI00241ED6BE|nr:thioesterase [Oxalobacter formigenes]